MSSCSSKKSTTDTQETSASDVTLSASATEVISEETKVTKTTGDVALCDACLDGSNTWYEVEVSDYGEYIDSCTRMYGSCQISIANSDNLAFTCTAFDDTTLLPLVRVIDTTDGAIIGDIEVPSIPGKNTEYYSFVWHDIPVLEMDVVNDYNTIRSASFYEIDVANMTIGDEIQELNDQGWAYIHQGINNGCIYYVIDDVTNNSGYSIIIDSFEDSTIVEEIINLDSVYAAPISYICSVLPYGEDTLAVSVYCEGDYNDRVYYDVLINYGSKAESEGIVSSSYPECVSDGYGVVFADNDSNAYISKSTGLYRVNVDGSLSVAVDYNNVMDCDINVGFSSFMSHNDDGSWSLIGYEYDDFDYSCKYVRLIPTTDNYSDREVIYVTGSDTFNPQYMQLIRAFNESNDKYYARLCEYDLSIESSDEVYAEQIGEAEDSFIYDLLGVYSDSLQVENKLIDMCKSSDAPDIIISNSFQGNLANSGAFMDMTDYINQYMTDNPDTLFDKLINEVPSYSAGSIYQIPLKFYITGIFNSGDTNDELALRVVEDTDYSTYDNYVDEVWNEDPLKGSLYKEEYAYEALFSCYSCFYDGASFNVENLKQYEEFIKTHCKYIPGSYWNNNVYQSIFSVEDLVNFSLIPYEDIDAYYSFPVPVGSSGGVVAGASEVISIPTGANNVDGAKAFIDFALSYEGQTATSFYGGIPVNKQAFETISEQLSSMNTEDVDAALYEDAIDYIEYLADNIGNLYVIDTKLSTIIYEIYLDGEVDEDVVDTILTRYYEM